MLKPSVLGFVAKLQTYSQNYLVPTGWINNRNHGSEWFTASSNQVQEKTGAQVQKEPGKIYPWWLVAGLRRAILLASIRPGDVSESMGWGCFIRSSYIFMAKTLADGCPIIPSEFNALIEPPRPEWLGSLRCNCALRCCMSCSCCSLALNCCA